MPKKSSKKKSVSDLSSNATKPPGKKHDNNRKLGNSQLSDLPTTVGNRNTIPFDVKGEQNSHRNGPQPTIKDRVFANKMRGEHLAYIVECFQYFKDRETALAEMIIRMEEEDKIKQLQNTRISVIDCSNGDSHDTVQLNSCADNIEPAADIKHTLDSYVKENAGLRRELDTANKRVDHALLAVVEAKQVQIATVNNVISDSEKQQDKARQYVTAAEERAERAEARAASIEQELSVANESIDALKQELAVVTEKAIVSSQSEEELKDSLKDRDQWLDDMNARYLSSLEEKNALEKKLKDAEEHTASLMAFFQGIGQEMLTVAEKVMAVTNANDTQGMYN